MKKINGKISRAAFSLVLTLSLLCTPAGAAAEGLASPSRQSVTVDGSAVALEAYAIGGYNYYKLRDIALVLNGTAAAFSVGWDGAANTITLVSGESYTPDGSELDVSRGDLSATAAVSSQSLIINGAAVSELSVYTLGGNNFFRLRELAAALGFSVSYDSVRDAVVILTDGGSTASGVLEVHFLDVGQGDSIFIELPDGRTMLIDAGEKGKGGAVADYVRGEGHEALDIVVATHPHSDHIGGLPAVFSELEVRSVYAPDKAAESQAYKSFIAAVAAEGLTLTSAVAGAMPVDTELLDVTVLSPAAGAVYTDVNDYSVVLLLTYRDWDFLFTGDAGSGVLLSSVNSAAEVVKLSHHGSVTGVSAALLEVLRPMWAVISCGAGNSYGHPHQSVLELLSDVTVLRTDIDGTVTAVCDGESVKWSR